MNTHKTANISNNWINNAITAESVMNIGKIYEGIDKDPKCAMNQTGNIIRDAWLFGIIPETETCAGWNPQRMDDLYDKVTKAWEPYAHLPSNLPPELLEKHQRIYNAAIEKAKSKGWNPDKELEDEA